MNTRKQKTFIGGEKVTAYTTNKIIDDAYKNQESIHNTTRSFEMDGTIPNGMKPLVNLDFINDIYSIPNSTGTGMFSSTDVSDVLTITNTPTDSLTINSNGDLETVTSGDFSFLHENDGERRGLLVDGRATSMFTTDDVTDASWTKYGVTVTPLGNILGGDVNGYRLITDSSDDTHLINTSLTSANSRHKHMFLVRKSATMQYIRTQMIEYGASARYVYCINFDLIKMETYNEDTSVINSGMVELKDGWVLCWIIGDITYGTTTSTCTILLPDPSDPTHLNLTYAGAGEYIDIALPCLMGYFYNLQLPQVINGSSNAQNICVGTSLSPVKIPRTSFTISFDVEMEVSRTSQYKYAWFINPSTSTTTSTNWFGYAIYSGDPSTVYLRSRTNSILVTHPLGLIDGDLARIKGACSVNTTTGEVKSVINGELVTTTLTVDIFDETDDLYLFIGSLINASAGAGSSNIFKSLRIYGDFIEDDQTLINMAN